MANDWKESTIADTWKPEAEGDEILGLLTRKEENVGPNNSMMYYLEDSKTHMEVGVWGATSLDISMRGVKVGEEVKIVFLGLMPSKKRIGKKFKAFKVYHREPNPDTYTQGFTE